MFSFLRLLLFFYLLLRFPTYIPCFFSPLKLRRREVLWTCFLWFEPHGQACRGSLVRAQHRVSSWNRIRGIVYVYSTVDLRHSTTKLHSRSSLPEVFTKPKKTRGFTTRSLGALAGPHERAAEYWSDSSLTLGRYKLFHESYLAFCQQATIEMRKVALGTSKSPCHDSTVPWVDFACATESSRQGFAMFFRLLHFVTFCRILSLQMECKIQKFYLYSYLQLKETFLARDKKQKNVRDPNKMQFFSFFFFFYM